LAEVEGMPEWVWQYPSLSEDVFRMAARVFTPGLVS